MSSNVEKQGQIVHRSGILGKLLMKKKTTHNFDFFFGWVFSAVNPDLTGSGSTVSDSVTGKYSTRKLFNPGNIPQDSDSIPVRLLREAGSHYIRLYSLVHLRQGI